MTVTALASLYIPSPTVSALQLGPLTVRFYALCILAGIVAAVWLGGRRLTARGGQPGAILDIAMWAVPFGIVGGRIYHVITSPELYFLPGKNPWDFSAPTLGAAAARSPSSPSSTPRRPGC